MFFTSARRFPPSVWGKLSTFVQIVTAAVWMGRNAFPVPVLNSLASLTIWPCALITLWSGVHYTWRGVGIARAH
jgi:phosphatidylglycerophosphate synthase